jgi:hypothetical protein
VAPTVVDVRRSPGESTVGTFSVRLRGEHGRRFAIAIEDVGQDSRGAFTFGPPGRSRFSAARWISLSPRGFGGAPDRDQPIEFRVRVPRDAEPGDHVTSLTVKRLAAAGEGSAALVAAVAVRLTVRVAGAARPAVELRDLEAPRLSGQGPIAGTVTVRNTGNVRLDFEGANRGALGVFDGDRERTRLPFTGLLYPGEARDFRLAWPDPPPLGQFRLRAGVRTPRGEVTASAGFWVVPWRQALALLLVVLAFVVLLGGRHRRRAAR